MDVNVLLYIWEKFTNFIINVNVQNNYDATNM